MKMLMVTAIICLYLLVKCPIIYEIYRIISRKADRYLKKYRRNKNSSFLRNFLLVCVFSWARCAQRHVTRLHLHDFPA